jgi:hypothetical protein
VGVLEAVTDDAQGSYRDLGQLYTGDDVAGSTRNRWAIDATPVRIRDRLYLVWSGWPDTRDIQYLYIAPMANPWTVAGSRVKLCENDTYAWERVGESTGQRGLHEAPQVLRRRGRLFVVYSCSGSWEPTYKLGMLSLDESDDPLRPENWHKRETPVFAPTEQTFGVGHCCFTRSPDDAEDWTVFHAKMSREHGWQRAVFMQPFRWVDGVPEFGRPVAPGLALPLPAGEAAPRSGSSFLDRFAGGNWDGWRYYGYGRYVSVDDGMLSLGGRPRWGLVNDFRSGEKVLVDGLEWSDLRVTVRLRFAGGRRDAGVLFRVRRPAVGYDAQQGYFAGLIPETGQVVLGRTDGARWTTLAIRSHPFDAAAWHTLSVEAVGPRLRVLVDGREALQAEDREYARGMAGLRVVDTHACFDDFQVEPR